MRRALHLALVAALATLAYLNTLGNQFVYDDGAQILRNYYIRDLRYLKEILTTNVWSFMGPHAVSNYYRPVMHLVYMGDYALFGYSPAGYHATSVLFHALNAVLVLLAAEALRLRRAVALTGAALFAVHPINTEAVAWVAGIPELTFTFFFLLSFWLYVRARPPEAALRIADCGLRIPVAGEPGPAARSPRSGHGWMAASVACAFLAYFSKETALMLPVVLAAYEHLLRKSPESQWRRIPAYSGHLLGVVLYMGMRIYSLGGFQVATNPYGVMSLWQFVLSVVYLLGKYVAKLLAPAPLNIFHVFRVPESIADWRVLAGGVLLLATTAAVVLLVRAGRRDLALLVGFVLLPLVPVLNMRAIGHNIFAERYLYLPAAFFCVLLAAAIFRLSGARTRWAVALTAILVLNYGLLTVFRNRDWHDDVMLYTTTLQVSPESNLIRDNLGKTFLDGYGRPDLALALFEECVRRAPERAEYHYGRGQALAELRRYDEALAALRRTLEIWWNYPEAHLARGDIYRELDLPESALAEYQRALEIKPSYAEALAALAALHHDRGEPRQAEQLLRRALAVTDLAEARLRLGLLLLDEDRPAEAEHEFRRVLVSERHSVPGWHGLGRALQAQGRAGEALKALDVALHERRFTRVRRFGRVPVPEEAVIRRARQEAGRQGSQGSRGSKGAQGVRGVEGASSTARLLSGC